jgi:hypothetical protein
MQSRPVPRRRQARAALLLTVAAAALAACLVVLTPALAAPRSGEITSSSVLRGPLDETYSLVLSGPAGIYAAGSTHEHNSDVLISKSSYANRNLGHFSWSNPNNMNGVDIVNAVAGDRFGNVIVAGNTLSSMFFSWDLIVLKVSPRMELQWAVVLDGGDVRSDFARAVACDAAGNVYVTGQRGTSQGDDIWTMKLAAKSGAIVWQTLYDAGLNDSGDSLCLDKRGNVYVAGYSQNAEPDRETRGASDLVTIRYDRHGVQQWATRTDSPLHGADSPRHIALDSLGALFVAGETWNATGTMQQHVWLVRLTADGRELWQRTLDTSPWKDTAWAFKVGPYNSLYIAGYGYQFVTEEPDSLTSRGLIARWNRSGKLLWLREETPPTGGRVEFRDLVVDDQGNTWCAGHQRLPGSDAHAVVIKYDKRGNELWSSAWDDPSDTDEMFFSLALVGSRSVFAAGMATAPTGDHDAVLVAYRR